MKSPALLAVAAALSLAGCATTGQFSAANLTEVQLREGNYELVTTDINGEAEAAYLIGVSGSMGSSTHTLALYRLRGTGQLYKEAMEDLWSNFAAAHGDVEGRRLALVNVRYDSESRNLLVYTDVKIAIRADVVEFD